MLAVINFLVMIYAFIHLSKRKSIKMDLKIGDVCYGCKSKIEKDFGNRIYNMLDAIDGENHLTLCKQCERDEKLSMITNHGIGKKINKIKLFLLGNSYTKFNFILLSILVLLLIIDLIFRYRYDLFVFNHIYNIYAILYWLIVIYAFRISSVKKSKKS